MRADDFAYLVLVQVLGMLGRDDNRRRPNGLAGDVFQSHLAFRIRTQARLGAGMAGFGEGTQNSVGIMNRRRHQDVGLGAGIAEHQSLVAGAFILVARGVDPLSDVG